MGQLPESAVNEVAADGQTYALAAVSATMQYRCRPGLCVTCGGPPGDRQWSYSRSGRRRDGIANGSRPRTGSRRGTPSTGRPPGQAPAGPPR